MNHPTRFYAKAKSVGQIKKEASYNQPAKIEKFTAETLKSVTQHDALLMVELLMQPQNKLPPLIKETEEALADVPDVDQYFANPANRYEGGFHHILSLAASKHDTEKGKQIYQKMKVISYH